MKRAKIVKMKLAELAGVDLGAQDAQGTVILKRAADRSPAVATTKRSAITTAVLGHTHLVYGIDDMQSGTTSSERVHDAGGSDSYGSYHSHPWVRTEDGTIVLGEAHGHTHAIGTAAASLEKARAGNSTTAQPISTVGNVNTEPTMPNANAETPEVVSLKKQLAAAIALANLTDAEKIYRATLPEHERDAFVAKSATERAEIMKAANEVVYTCLDGTVVTKSQGPAMLAMAKRADEALKLAQTEKAARELAELTKRANDTLGNLSCSVAAKVALLKAAESISDEAVRGEALKALSGVNEVYRLAGTMKGSTDESGATLVAATTEAGALAALEKGLLEYAAAEKISNPWTEALPRFVQTEKGAALQRAYDEAKGK